MKSKKIGALLALAAAALYAVNVPLSKLLLERVDTTMMASLLYLGAGIGMFALGMFRKVSGKADNRERLTKRELPYTIAMVVLDIAAPILLMLGIANTNSANVSLLNNFEIVATTLIALIVFKEFVSFRLWSAILLVVAASAILTFEGTEGFTFNTGSLFVLGASVCWGFENNCTRKISNKSSEEIVIIKGIGSGLGSLAIAFAVGERLPDANWLILTLILGFVSYGLSINFYIMAQNVLGAAKTSAYYSIAPFLGVLFSMLLVGERPGVQFYIAFAVMIISTVIIVIDTFTVQHTHEHTHVHTHEHRHGEMLHTHEYAHSHSHNHSHMGDENEHMHNHFSALPQEHEHSHSH